MRYITSTERFVSTRGAHLLDNNRSLILSAACGFGGSVYLVLSGFLIGNAWLETLPSRVAVVLLVAFGLGHLYSAVRQYWEFLKVKQQRKQIPTATRDLLNSLQKSYQRGLPFFLRKMSFAKTNLRVPLELEDLVEACCSEYNRIGGCLQICPESNSFLARSAGRVYSAADEAIFDVFHQAATANMFPEVTVTARHAITNRLNSLAELARFVDLAVCDAPVLERLTIQDSMSEILEEMRLDLRSRYEI